MPSLPHETRRQTALSRPVSDFMRTDIVKVSPDTSVADLVTLLLERGLRSAPVVAPHGRLLGIITDGDLLRRAGLMTRLSLQGDLSSQQVSGQVAALRRRPQFAADIMSRPVTALREKETLRAAVEKMAQESFKRLPVVDANQRLVGWISRLDVLAAVQRGAIPPPPERAAPAQGATVPDLMHRAVATVSPAAPLNEIVEALERSRQRRVVVIDEERRVAGIITDGDLLRRSQARREPSLLSRLAGLLSTSPRSGAAPGLPDGSETAAALMTAPVLTVSLGASPAEALHLLMTHKIKRLPVVDEEGRLVGLLGRAALLHWLLASAGG